MRTVALSAIFFLLPACGGVEPAPISPAEVAVVPEEEDQVESLRADEPTEPTFSENLELTAAGTGYDIWTLSNHGDEAIVGLEQFRNNPALAGFFEQEQPNGTWAHVGARNYSRTVTPPPGELAPGDSFSVGELMYPTTGHDYLDAGQYRFVVRYRRASRPDEVQSVSARFDISEHQGARSVVFR